MNVGFRNAIQQSDYTHYINRFQREHGVNVTNYRFEDLVKDPDFPHINETLPEHKVKWTDQQRDYVQDHLDKAGISY